jgi:hypothetical protein
MNHCALGPYSPHQFGHLAWPRSCGEGSSPGSRQLERRHSQSGATSSTQAPTAGWSGLCEMSIPFGSIPMPRSNKPCAPCLPPITRTGSAWAAVKYFREQGLLFPRRVRTGPHAGTIHWAPLIHNTVLKVLRNPRYAGAFCYGRTHSSKRLDGRLRVETVPQEEWPFLLQNAHVGYISWDDYEANRQQLRQNRQTFGGDRRHGPREKGPPCCKDWSSVENVAIA